jgi:mRNA-degrading endonuclease RelE of RelBE toxin-antitoxin system
MKVEFHKQAEKFILRLPENQQKRIIKAAYKLPRGDVAALKSRPGKFYIYS